MIHEYALEPTVLSAWASNDRDYAEFLREYGLGTPRLASSFPKKKVSKLRSYLLQHSPQDTQSLAGLRYTEMVMKLIESVVIRDVDDHQSSAWSEAAVIENNKTPFSVILSSSAIDAKNNITPDNMYLPDSAWNHSAQLKLQRTNSGLLSAFGNLVRLSSKHIVIIDPYGWTKDAIGFIQYMINSISHNRFTDALPKIILFFKKTHDGRNPTADHVKSLVMQGLNGEVENLEFEVFELNEAAKSDVFHNRFILTEHGGVMTGHGIGVSNKEEHTDVATLIRSDIYEKEWQQFIENNCFDVISSA